MDWNTSEEPANQKSLTESITLETMVSSIYKAFPGYNKIKDEHHNMLTINHKTRKLRK